jgi:hypothetical protein
MHLTALWKCTNDWQPQLHCKNAIFLKIIWVIETSQFSAMICCSFLPHVSSKINIILKFLFIVEKFLPKILQPSRATIHMGNLSLVAKHAAMWQGSSYSLCQHNNCQGSTQLPYQVHLCIFTHHKDVWPPELCCGFSLRELSFWCISVQLMLLGSTEATFIATSPGGMNILSLTILPQNVSFWK